MLTDDRKMVFRFPHLFLRKRDGEPSSYEIFPPVTATLRSDRGMDFASGGDREAAGEIDPYAPPKLLVDANNHPQVILADPRVEVIAGPEHVVIQGGLQPSMVITRTGAIVVQSQLPEHPHKVERQSSHWAMGTVISRDGGQTWTRIPLPAEKNGVNMEGGAIQLRDGSLLALDTYVVPGGKPGEGMGERYVSKDDWQTLQGPEKITVNLPGVDFLSSKDDMGRPHNAVRFHRRIIELNNGDLLTTLYGWFEGDNEPAGYMPTMKKTRVVLMRSTDRGRHWNLVSTVAADPTVGTEGFNEAVLVRINSGPWTGRLICQMRTGREQREATSDDEDALGRRPIRESTRIAMSIARKSGRRCSSTQRTSAVTRSREIRSNLSERWSIRIYWSCAAECWSRPSGCACRRAPTGRGQSIPGTEAISLSASTTEKPGVMSCR